MGLINVINSSLGTSTVYGSSCSQKRERATHTLGILVYLLYCNWITSQFTIRHLLTPSLYQCWSLCPFAAKVSIPIFIPTFLYLFSRLVIVFVFLTINLLTI